MSWDAFDTGIVRLVDDQLEYERDVVEWTLKVQDIAVVGEWLEDVTLAPHPMNHWWVFVDKEAVCHAVPSRAAGMEFVRRDLLHLIGCELQRVLFGHGLASRVTWPESLSGVELFTYVPLPARGLIGRIQTLLCGQDVDVQLHAQVKKALGHTDR